MRYAEEHFQHEEALMAAAHYPQLDEHRQAHEELVDRRIAQRARATRHSARD